MRGNIKEIIINEFKRNRLTYNDHLGEILELYANLLITENKKYNLTSITSFEDIVNKHFIDSILGFEKFKGKTNKVSSLVLMDIGTGAGFPGVPLVLYDQLCNEGKGIKKVHLVDSNKKKTEFLFLICDILKDSINKNLISIHNNRLESLQLTTQLDLFLSRATGSINKVIDHLAEFLAKNKRSNNTAFLLYYGGAKFEHLKDGYNSKGKIESGKRVEFDVSSKIIEEFEFSIENYKRVNVLYSLSPKI
ncbi:16S rRNA (guanine(527)-N(7))-methyltransferase RsmG [bacterium]|nr:16S rRNA (guanine(527)-N(7))-methyltransferase RsmG [bacterium]|tara:strand:+ start:1254 stop:2000 length:747 start_codon:yes stop_codon:yes gene_type:complete